MDEARAKRIAEELRDQSVGGWRVTDLINNGKSAVVLKALKDGQEVALKILDPDLVSLFGEEAQLERVKRELSTSSYDQKSLVKILDGGKCADSGYLFVVMELIPFQNLAHYLGGVPVEAIRSIIAKVAEAARFLESLGLAHRDIKPDNIVVSSDFTKVVLLDLGVLRPTRASSLTDDDHRPFIATYRYSPPEYLLREEADSVDGWRAVTFYQLGGVLHDMLTGRRLFSESEEPLARLINAVQRDVPRVENPAAPQDLVALARNCLQKDPRLRLRLVSWNDFLSEPPDPAVLASLEDRVRKRQAASLPLPPGQRQAQEQETAQRRFMASLVSRLQALVRDHCVADTLFPPIEINDLPSPSRDSRYFSVLLSPSRQHAVSAHLSILFRAVALDRESEALALSVAAACGEAPLSTIPDTVQWQSVYEGVFQDDLLHGRLAGVLCGYLDLAQLRDQSAEQSGHPSDISWLRSPEILESGEIYE